MADAAAGDASLDAGSESSPDTRAPEVLVDASADVGPDIATDAPTDAATDVPPDVSSPFEHAGVTVTTSGDRVTLSNGVLEVTFDLAVGTFEVEGGGAKLIERAESRILYLRGGDEARAGTMDAGERSFEAAAFEDALGSGATLVARFVPVGGGPGLTTSIDLRAGATWLTVATEAIWAALPGEPVQITHLSPLVADEDTGGALYVGDDPAEHRVLNNGSDLYLDMAAQVSQVGDALTFLFPPGQASNWDIGIYDPETHRGFVAGFLSSLRGTGILAVDYEAQVAPTAGGRSGFTRFDAISYYMDLGRAPIVDAAGGQGGRLTSELLYVDFPPPNGPTLPPSVLEALESFAARYAQRIGKTVWTDIPSGWNSWGGGAGSGGLGTNIDEALILANLDLAAADFAPWGMKYFMIDDGWQDAKGDWNTNPERFPDHDGLEGMAWIAEQIRQRGMVPGIWISPFEIGKKSQIAHEHPDWWADVSAYGSTFVPSNIHIPDLSRPEVLDWLAALFTKVTQEWGYRWIKMDFSYFAMFATNLHDPSVSPSEAFRGALMRIREAIGPETFYLMISATGISFEMADGNRITLDNEPWFNETVSLGEPGFKTTYMTVAGRYYLSHNLWVNHPDLLFWRDDYGLTLEEARTWTTAVALTGGIVKLGETYTAMHEHPEWREQVYPLLPIYPKSGRPLDLFHRAYPEVWDLRVEREGRTWTVLGLFNWGVNRDIGGEWEDPAPRTLTRTLAELGLDPAKRHLAFDAWARTWRWIEDGQVTETLASHATRALVLREEPTAPAIVFTTRHLLGGAVEVHGEALAGDPPVLSATIDTVAGAQVTVFAADAGHTLAEALVGSGVDAATIDTGQQDGLVWVTFTPAAAATEVELRFAD